MNSNKKDLRFTVIHHKPRIRLGLTFSEYCIGDSIYQLSNNPKHPICTKSLADLGAFIGLSKRAAITIAKNLVAKDLVKKITDGKRHLGWKSTQRWYQEVVLATFAPGGEETSPSYPPGEETSPGGAKIQGDASTPTGEDTSPKEVNALHQKGEPPSPPSYKNNNTSKQQQLRLLLLDLKFSQQDADAILEHHSFDRIESVLKSFKEHRDDIDSPVGWIKSALKEGWSLATDTESEPLSKEQQGLVTKIARYGKEQGIVQPEQEARKLVARHDIGKVKKAWNRLTRELNPSFAKFRSFIKETRLEQTPSLWDLRTIGDDEI